LASNERFASLIGVRMRRWVPFIGWSHRLEVPGVPGSRGVALGVGTHGDVRVIGSRAISRAGPRFEGGWCVARGSVAGVALRTRKLEAGPEMDPDHLESGPVGADFGGLDVRGVEIVGLSAGRRASRRVYEPSRGRAVGCSLRTEASLPALPVPREHPKGLSGIPGLPWGLAAAPEPLQESEVALGAGPSRRLAIGGLPCCGARCSRTIS
jgi:hypothetical protein